MPENISGPAPLSEIFSSSVEQSPAPSAKTETPTETPDTSSKSKVDDASASEEKSKEAPESTKEEETSEGKEGDETTEGDESEEVDEALLSDEEKAAKKKEADEKAAADAKTKADEKAAADKVKADDESFKKRFEDTAKWAREVNERNKQLESIAREQQQALAMLQKKVDGTWTDEDEAASKSSADTPESAASRGVLAGKAVASNAAAIREFGQEKVTEVLTEFHSLFSGNEVVRQVVSDADSPVHTAMHMVDRFHFEQAYGFTPAEWIKNIGTEAEKRLRPVITKEIMEKIKAGKTNKEGTPSSLASAKGGKGDEGKLKEVSPVPLENLFDSNKRT